MVQLKKSVSRVMVSRKALGSLFSIAGTTIAGRVFSSTPRALVLENAIRNNHTLFSNEAYPCR